jgi:DNA-directed RNA polymerase subunit RPC12/RpoP
MENFLFSYKERPISQLQELEIEKHLQHMCDHIAKELTGLYRSYLRKRREKRPSAFDIDSTRRRFSIPPSHLLIYVEPEKLHIAFDTGIQPWIPILCAAQHKKLIADSFFKNDGWEIHDTEFYQERKDWYVSICVRKIFVLKQPKDDAPTYAILTNKNEMKSYAAYVLAVKSNGAGEHICDSLCIGNSNQKSVRRYFRARHRKLRTDPKRKKLDTKNRRRLFRFNEWVSHTISANLVEWIMTDSKDEIPKVVVGVARDADQRLVRKIRYKFNHHQVPVRFIKLERIFSRIRCPSCGSRLIFGGKTNSVVCQRSYFGCGKTYNFDWLILRYITPSSVRKIKRIPQKERNAKLRKIERKLTRRLSAVRQKVRQ